MLVLIPSPLQSYTQNKTQVEAKGSTVKELLDDLEKQYPGLRFRMIDEQDNIRQHIKIFVNNDGIERISHGLDGSERVKIVAALSGG